ncbi:aminopeptidase [Fictibacillus sp. FJAT-27399]|uniref:aminopeptidase n=1 Tax=Fictibacillus sp. FJAT-27399 TaxID=1729689 RepID=UPI00078442D4|nr:aminopeptidase [Fictibacillus sp. FJAT-27399]
MDFQKDLQKYAELIIKVGVNIQPGQVLYIESPLESVEFTRIVVRKAYEAGSKYVQVNWDDEGITRSRFESAYDDSFDYYPKWKASEMEQIAESGGAILNLVSPNPVLFEGIDPNKIAKARRAAASARQNYLGYIRSNKISWCLINVPTRAWVDKVFFDLPAEERMAAMWESIFYMNRVDKEDPIISWNEHIRSLKSISDKLNDKRYKKLHYSAPGTNLTVELIQDHVWTGGGSINQAGNRFVANMPTEEVFTMPLRGGTNGTVKSTMPLNLNGNLIEDFSLTFENGKVTHFTAEKGYDALKTLFETDEGARYLGEVALVPHRSPISDMNRIFYNIGLDENASCHFALGNAYPFNLEGGIELSKEDLISRGVNMSMIHVDFMIGSSELDIDGELPDGTIESLFRKGNWA